MKCSNTKYDRHDAKEQEDETDPGPDQQFSEYEHDRELKVAEGENNGGSNSHGNYSGNSEEKDPAVDISVKVVGISIWLNSTPISSVA